MRAQEHRAPIPVNTELLNLMGSQDPSCFPLRSQKEKPPGILHFLTCLRTLRIRSIKSLGNLLQRLDCLLGNDPEI